MNVYEATAAPITAAPSTLAPTTAAPTAALEQGGCYKETNPRLLGTKKWAGFLKDGRKLINSPAACKKFCEGSKFYGVQATNQCFCGDKLHGKLEKLKESECN